MTKTGRLEKTTGASSLHSGQGTQDAAPATTPAELVATSTEQTTRAGKATRKLRPSVTDPGAQKKNVGARSPLFVSSNYATGIEGAAMIAVAEETRRFTASMSALIASHDDLTSTGRDYALIALARHPKLGPEIAAHFARLHLHAGIACLSRDKDLKNLTSLPLKSRELARVAKELDQTLQQMAAMLSERGAPPIYLSDGIANVAAIIDRLPALAAHLDARKLERIHEIFAAFLASSRMGSDRGSEFAAVSAIATAAVTLEKQKPNDFSAQFVLDALAPREAYGSIVVRASLASGRAVPEACEARVRSALLNAMTTVTERNYVYNIDFLDAQLRLARGAFEARGDAAGMKTFAASLESAAVLDEVKQIVRNILLTETAPKAEPTPAFRIGVGTTVINIGGEPQKKAAPSYDRQGPADRATAVANLKDAYDRGAFYENAGDEAIRALADPHFENDAIAGFKKILDHSHGSMIARDIIDRINELGDLGDQFPELAQVRARFMDLVIAKIESGGSAAEDLTYLLESRSLTAAEQLRICTASLAAHQLPLKKDSEWDYNSEESRTQRRGIAYRVAVEILGNAAVGDLSDAEIKSVKGALTQSTKWLTAVLGHQRENLAENSRAEETSEETKRLLASASKR